jgi:hypothetical protein
MAFVLTGVGANPTKYARKRELTPYQAISFFILTFGN